MTRIPKEDPDGRVSLPPRPADGGGLPKTEADLAARLENTADIVLDALLEREVRNERVLRSQLDFVQMKIRVARAEKARRRGLDLQADADAWRNYALNEPDGI